MLYNDTTSNSNNNNNNSSSNNNNSNSNSHQAHELYLGGPTSIAEICGDDESGYSSKGGAVRGGCSGWG